MRSVSKNESTWTAWISPSTVQRQPEVSQSLPYSSLCLSTQLKTKQDMISSTSTERNVISLNNDIITRTHTHLHMDRACRRLRTSIKPLHVITTSRPQNYTQLTPEFSATRQSISSGTVANGCFKWQNISKRENAGNIIELSTRPADNEHGGVRDGAVTLRLKHPMNPVHHGRTTSVAGFEGVRSDDGMGTGGWQRSQNSGCGAGRVDLLNGLLDCYQFFP